jgi:hypothetical protein
MNSPNSQCFSSEESFKSLKEMQAHQPLLLKQSILVVKKGFIPLKRHVTLAAPRTIQEVLQVFEACFVTDPYQGTINILTFSNPNKSNSLVGSNHTRSILKRSSTNNFII